MKKIIQLAAYFLLVSALAGAQVPSFVPVPFGQVFAGIAPGGTAIACPSTADIPNTQGTHLGDGCLATQATLGAPYSATVDSYGNVYISDYNNYSLRVVYQGNAALAAAIVAANPGNANLVPTPGHIYTIAGARSSSLTKTGSPTAYYCNSAASGPIAIVSNGDGCPASYAYIKPRSVTLDSYGNIFFTSASGSAPVRVVVVGGGPLLANLLNKLESVATPQAGYIYSIIKSAANGYNGDGMLATNATVATYAMRDVAVDSNENVYMSDGTNSFTPPNYASNNDVRMVNGSTGVITTFAGSPNCAQGTTAGCAGTFGGDGGPATAATFNAPYAMFLDPNNNLYLADYNEGRLRVVYNSGSVPGLANLTPGYVYTVAGGGTSTTTGTPATQVSFGSLFNAGMDPAGNILAQDGTSKFVWRIDAKTGIATIIGNITPVASAGTSCGTGTGLTSSDKVGSGCPSTEEAFSASGRFSFDANGNFYEDESSNAVIRKFSYNTVFPSTTAGMSVTQSLAFVTPVAGTTITSQTYSFEGAAAADFTAAGTGNCAFNTALTINTTCVFPTTFKPAVAGLREGSLTLNPNSTSSIAAFLSGIGSAANASVDPASSLTIGSGLSPSGVATDLNGKVYLSDSTANKVFSAPVAGGAVAATTLSGLSKPSQPAIDGQGNFYVADTGNNRVAYVPLNGTGSVALGTGLSAPRGVAVDGQGDVFIADTGNNRIVEISSVAGVLGNQITLNITGLSAPSALAIDPAGDLFIADTGNSRVVEVPPYNSQIVVNLGTAAIKPLGLAVDAAGDLYVLDGNSLGVLEFPAGSTLSNQLVTGLKSPNGLAIDAAGSLYVSDSGFTGVLAYNRNIPTISYSPTNVGTSNIATLDVTNTGNLPLTFPGPQLTTATGTGTADFSVTAASTNGCAVSSPLALGAECGLTATFAPIVKNPTLSETASLVTNAPASAGALLTGAGVQLIATTSSLAVTSPTTSTINYAQNVTVTDSVTAASSAGTAPTGIIIFSVDGKTQPTQTLSGSNALLTLTSPGVGTHSVTVSYSGDSNYASSSNSTSFNIAKAATTTTLTITPSTSVGATSLTFSAKVVSTTATGATGTVTFYSGTTVLSTQTLGVNGTASFTTTTTNYTAYSFTAVYSGDANFATSTSGINAPTADFSVAPASPTVSIAVGGVASEYINVTSLYNYSGTIKPTCSGLPANAVCRFAPTSLALTGGATQSLQILIYTSVNSSIARNESPFRKSLIAFALLLPAALFVRRRKFLVPLLALLAIGFLGGCQGTGSITPTITPLGSSTVMVTLTDSNNVTHAQTLTFTVLAD